MPQDMPPVGGYDAVQYKVGLISWDILVVLWFGTSDALRVVWATTEAMESRVLW